MYSFNRDELFLDPQVHKKIPTSRRSSSDAISQITDHSSHRGSFKMPMNVTLDTIFDEIKQQTVQHAISDVN